LMQSRHDEAGEYFREGLELANELDVVVLRIACLDGLAAVLAATGDAAQAATIAGAVDSAVADTSVSLEPFERELHARTLATVTNELDEDAFAVAYGTGLQLSREEAVAYALGAASAAPKARTGL